ncbi:hypothetical protein SUDANB5_06742 [Streptomyces sp. SudanB5_2050]
MTNNMNTTNNTNTTEIAPVGLLTGKVVFITGASRGIGAAAARLFASEGAAVVLAARSTDALETIVKEIRAVGGSADAVPLDLADSASIRAAVDQVEKLHGRLDGAFNNGAVPQQQFGPVHTTSDEDIDEQFAVNFRAHWTAMNAEAALMRKNGGGAIVNTSSIGSRRANPALPAYGAMKRALNSLTETAAVNWAGDPYPGQRHHPRGHRHGDDRHLGGGDPRHRRADDQVDPARSDGRAPADRRGGRMAAQRPRLVRDRRDPAGRRRRRRLSKTARCHPPRLNPHGTEPSLRMDRPATSSGSATRRPAGP